MNLFESYKILRNLNPDILQTEVNGHKRMGWRLHGFTLPNPHTGEWFQVVKRSMPKSQQQELRAA